MLFGPNNGVESAPSMPENSPLMEAPAELIVDMKCSMACRRTLLSPLLHTVISTAMRAVQSPEHTGHTTQQGTVTGRLEIENH